MRLEVFKLNEIYLWQDNNTKYLEKVILISNEGITTKFIKKICPDTPTQDTHDMFWSKNELRGFCILTAIEKIKYL